MYTNNIPTLGPNVGKSYLHWAIWIPNEDPGVLEEAPKFWTC